MKGISGGQKRRLSVGMELVTNPRVLVLDEPTSGLDSEIAITIMTTLKELALKGRTVSGEQGLHTHKFMDVLPQMSLGLSYQVRLGKYCLLSCMLLCCFPG